MAEENRLRTWCFSLLYPAVLGSLIVGLAQTNAPLLHIVWGGLMAIYFLAIFGEGVLDKRPYDGFRFFFDLAEMALMLLIFGSLKLFSGSSHFFDFASYLSPHIYVAAALAVPILERVTIFRKELVRTSTREGVSKKNYFYLTLTLLSLAALIAAVWFGISEAGAWTLFLIIGFYLVFFVLLNKTIFGENGALSRHYKQI